MDTSILLGGIFKNTGEIHGMFGDLQLVWTMENVGQGKRQQEVSEVEERDQKEQSQESNTEEFQLNFFGSVDNHYRLLIKREIQIETNFLKKTNYCMRTRPVQNHGDY